MEATAAQGLALSIGLGAVGSAIADRVRMPALPLLIGLGLLMGETGVGWIDTGGLGDALAVLVALSIGMLVFEGSTHLTVHELRHAPRAVVGLLTIGAGVTWGGVALVGWLAGLHPLAATLLGACVIVTGPTVIQPLLRRTRLTPPLHTALAAEAIFIDPVGLIATVVTLDIARSYLAAQSVVPTISDFVQLVILPVGGGAAIGGICGVVGLLAVRRLMPPGRLESRRLNLFSIGLCMASYGAGESVAGGGGLTATTLCAVIFGHARVPGVGKMRDFNEQLSSILVGMLFVMLAARFDGSRLADLRLADGLIVLLTLCLIRPACVLLSTLGSKLSWREKLMACLVAPRGVVAFSVVSIAAIDLAAFAQGQVAASGAGLAVSATRFLADVGRVEVIIFALIVVSVMWAVVALPVGSSVLGVGRVAPNGVMLVGIHPLAMSMADVLRKAGVTVLLLDRSPQKAEQARTLGFDAVCGDVTDISRLDDLIDGSRIGYLIAWTGNEDVDRVAARWGQDRFGDQRVKLWPGGAVGAEFGEATLVIPAESNSGGSGQPRKPFDAAWQVSAIAIDRPRSSPQQRGKKDPVMLDVAGLNGGQFTLTEPANVQLIPSAATPARALD